MKPIPNYPLWLSAFMLLGPFCMVGEVGLGDRGLIRILRIVGACMVMIALFYLSYRLHEQAEVVATLRRLLDGREGADGVVSRAGLVEDRRD